MRILHVVTLVTPDGSLGGPLRVAVNLMKASQAEGHEVLLVAGAQNWGSTLPSEYEGVPVKLFKATSVLPGSGFAGLTAPALLAWLKQTASTADVVHVHMARDLVTLPAALVAQAAGASTVLHTHGMIDLSDRLLAKPLDALMTRRALRSAKRIIALTDHEKNDVQTVDPSLDDSIFDILPNGVPLADYAANHSVGEDIEVLFLARLQERKRPAVFVRVAQKLAQEFPNAKFTLVGPDGGEGNAVLELLANDNADGRIRWEGSMAPEETVERMAKSQIYVLPSLNEPYAMSLLEAMTVGLPVVIMADSGLSSIVKEYESGFALDEDSLENVTDAVRQLIQSEELRVTMGSNGKKLVEENCSMKKITERLHNIYIKAAQ